VLEIEDKGAKKKVDEFLYESIHLTVRIPQSMIEEVLAEAHEDIGSFEELKNLTCEIQLRTILQDAWAEVEHELVYKSEFSPFDLPMRRKLASINASLNLADIVFQELRDYQNKFNAEVAMRRQNFYHQADEATTLDGISPSQRETVAVTVPPPNFLRGTIDELLLDAIPVHNMGDYEGAISIYSRIINFDPPPPPVALSIIYKHRGMAHFSRHDYEEALGDFTLSLQQNPENFQAQYYSGIVHSLRGDDEKALACFSKSLAISPYQAHVHYRKALAEYNLGQYQAALVTLDECVKLGFEDDEVKRLNAKLVEKFDMKV
jgi:tetratricopeptide (TPR) repeat protein